MKTILEAGADLRMAIDNIKEQLLKDASRYTMPFCEWLGRVLTRIGGFKA